tara:strand:- start:4 stop:423 length:420 start_codon:yes stop_codon:yes gene_type:complete
MLHFAAVTGLSGMTKSRTHPKLLKAVDTNGTKLLKAVAMSGKVTCRAPTTKRCGSVGGSSDNYNNDFGNSMEMNSWLVSVLVIVGGVSLLALILGVANNDGKVEACQSVCNSDAEWGRIHSEDDNSCICIIREAVVFPN